MFVVFLSSLLILANCYTMLNFYATFEELSACSSYPTLTWDQCVSVCQQNFSCYYAYNLPSVSCSLCGYGAISNIVYTEDPNNTILSMKSNASNCEISQQLLDAQQIDSLKIGKTPTYNCSTGWQTFSRESGNWCMRFHEESDVFNRSTGESYCQTLYNATLTGFQTLDEIKTMYDIAAATYHKSGSMFIGALRWPSCYNVNINCTQLSSFYWTDGVTTGTDGFYGWGNDQPSNYSYKCAILNSTANELADISCDSLLGAAICGKLATEE